MLDVPIWNPRRVLNDAVYSEEVVLFFYCSPACVTLLQKGRMVVGDGRKVPYPAIFFTFEENTTNAPHLARDEEILFW